MKVDKEETTEITEEVMIEEMIVEVIKDVTTTVVTDVEVMKTKENAEEATLEAAATTTRVDVDKEAANPTAERKII